MALLCGTRDPVAIKYEAESARCCMLLGHRRQTACHDAVAVDVAARDTRNYCPVLDSVHCPVLVYRRTQSSGKQTYVLAQAKGLERLFQ
jgi:hypothetical protein